MLNGHFEIVCSQKLIRSLADKAEIFAKLKEDVMETFSWNALASISWLAAIVIKGLMIWGSKCHQNDSPVVCDCYV